MPGAKIPLPPTQLSREAIKEIEADLRSRDARVVDWGAKPSFNKMVLSPYIDLSNHCAVVHGT